MTAIAFSVTALGVFAFATIGWVHRLKRVAIPHNRLAFLALWSLAVLLGLTGLMTPGGSWVSGTVGALAALGGAVMLTLYALGKQRSDRAIEVGHPIPAFSAPDEHGVTFQSTSLAGTLTLIKFFRGHW
jgi:predicted membrane-bound mannosyltransferase